MAEFKIAVAQAPSIPGDIAENVHTHANAIRRAAEHEVSVLVFGELSLTGYEPDLAAKHALETADGRLGSLAALAVENRMHVVVGAPLANGEAMPCIGAIVFHSDGTRNSYRKMHLGGDEPRSFSPGDRPFLFRSRGETIGLAICADSSKESHPQTYSESGCGIYAAGVFLNAEWYATDAPRLASYSSRFRMLVVMANHGASRGTYASVGRSAIWSPYGTLLAEAEGTKSSLVIATRAADGWRGEVHCL